MTALPFGPYMVNELGQIRNAKGKLIKPYVHKSRNIFYLRVNLNKKKIFVHRLVWALFGDAPVKAGFQVDHIDTNAFNNNIKNLRCVSHLQNQNQNQKNKRAKKC